MNLRFYLKLFLILLLTGFVTISFAATQENSTIPGRFLVLSDIHFDPFSSCRHAETKPCPLVQALIKTPPSAWRPLLQQSDTGSFYRHEDANYLLLHSTLTFAKTEAAKQHVQFVLVLGDMLGHYFRGIYKTYSGDLSEEGYRAFVHQVFVFLNNEMEEAFPNVDIYMLPGNHDDNRSSYSYYVEPNGAFYKELSVLWAQLIKNKANRAAMLRTFPAGGYYALTLPETNKIRLIMLNTILFSSHRKGPQLDVAANQELNWLRQELASVKEKNQIAWIGIHIPSAKNLYSAGGNPLWQLDPLWYTEYSQRFQGTLERFSKNIAIVLAGHLHTNWCDVVAGGESPLLIVGIPSISPILGNDPEFKIYRYSKESGRLEGVTSYTYPFEESTAQYSDSICH